jgi:hypothetical protein
MPRKTPRTAWLARSRMKLRSTREVYCVEASDKETMTTEKTTPATVIIEPATAESIAREPSASATKSLGYSWRKAGSSRRSISIRPSASRIEPITMSDGRNQRLDRTSMRNFFRFPIGVFA